MQATRILIADDHTLVREGIVSMLSRFEDINVIGEASNGKEAIEKVNDLRPEIVLMDISMPGLGGLEATLEIRKVHPEVKILILTQYDDKEYVSRFLKAGVSGYILKKALGMELLTAIRAVARGESYLHPSIAGSVIDRFVSKKKDHRDDVLDKLTSRETQILKLLAEGNSHKEIATTLGISVKTVISHQTNISDKLDIHSRAGLIKFAIRSGLIRIDP